MDINRTRQGNLTGYSPAAAPALCGFNILKLSAVAGLPLMRQLFNKARQGLDF